MGNSATFLVGQRGSYINISTTQKRCSSQTCEKGVYQTAYSVSSQLSPRIDGKSLPLAQTDGIVFVETYALNLLEGHEPIIQSRYDR